MMRCFSGKVWRFYGVFLGWHMTLVAPVGAQNTPHADSHITEPPASSPPHAKVTVPAHATATTPSEEKTPPSKKRTSPTKDEPVFEPSFGTYRDSLMFSPTDTRIYLDAIAQTERKLFSGITLSDADVTNLAREKSSTVAQALDYKNMIFPHFYMPTLLYHNPSHWWVKINDTIITPKTNTDTNELYIADIQPQRVSILWKPQNKNIFSAMTHMKLDTLDEDHKRAIAHRAAKTVIQPKMLDHQEALRFTLQPNQVFYSKYMRVYEGHPRGILLTETADNTASQSADAPHADSKNQDEQLERYQELLNGIRQSHAERKQNKHAPQDTSEPTTQTQTNPDDQKLSPLAYMEQVLKDLQASEHKKNLSPEEIENLQKSLTAAPTSAQPQTDTTHPVPLSLEDKVSKTPPVSLESLPESSDIPTSTPAPDPSLMQLESLDSLDAHAPTTSPPHAANIPDTP